MALARWFIARNKEKVGPFAPTELKQLAQYGLLKPDEFLLKEGVSKWVKANSVTWLFASAGETIYSLDSEEAALYLAGKNGDVLARLISNLMEKQRHYVNNPALSDSIETTIRVLRVKREELAGSAANAS